METTATKLKFTAKQEDLLVLKHLANIAKANGINPILQYVNLEPISNTELKAWVTNIDITMSTIIPVQMDEQEELSLNAQKLYQVISTMNGIVTFNDGCLKSKEQPFYVVFPIVQRFLRQRLLSGGGRRASSC